MNDLKRLLASVGMTNFIHYYKNYQDLYEKRDKLTQEDKNKLAEKLLKENPGAYSLQAQLKRINKAIKIFELGLQVQALESVVESHNFKITAEIKRQAQNLLSS